MYSMFGMTALVGPSIQKHQHWHRSPVLVPPPLSTTAFPAEHPRMVRARDRLFGGTLCPPPSLWTQGSEALLPTWLPLKAAKDAWMTGSWTPKFLLICTLNAGQKPGSVLLNHLPAQTTWAALYQQQHRDPWGSLILASANWHWCTGDRAAW